MRGCYEYTSTILETTREGKRHPRRVRQGIEKGIKKERLLITRNMLAKGLYISVISQVTELSEEEIQFLCIN